MSDNYRTREERRKAKQQTKKTNTNKKSKGLFKKSLTAFGIIMLIMLIGGAVSVFGILRGAPDLDPDRLTLAQNPEIYDRNGELMTTLQTAENRRSVNINDVPDLMKDAVLSVEDVRFYDHFGLDMRRIGGAVVANVTGGFGSEGASTITQQVVKNLFLTMDKTMARKIQEQYLAIRLEQQYTKDQILEMYLNAIYYSGGRYGVVEAADYYFSKELDELTVADAALLAGIPQRPNHFNPFNNPEGAEQRRNIVIGLMEKHGKISAEEAEEARSISVQDQLNRSERDPNPYQVFLEQALTEVEAIDGIEPSDIYTSGLKIHTTLDQDLQQYVEQVMESGDPSIFPNDKIQAGITLLDTKTGEVLAIGGLREEPETQFSYNWATKPRNPQQPGSTIKPILDYGPAVNELKWSTYHQIVDEPYNFVSTGDPVRNASGNHRGSVSMREALKDSLNVPAVKAFNEVGVDKAKAFGERLGLNLDSITEAYSIGGFSKGVTPFEMAGAYAAFGNNGQYNRPHTVTRIEFQDGQTINLSPEPVAAMEDYTAFMLTDMMKTVVQSGTGTNAAVSGVPIAGKTGSSNLDREVRERYGLTSGVRDSWFAGYSTELTAAVWAGYASPEDGVIQLGTDDARVASNLFRTVMSYAHENREVSDFVQPDSVVRVAIERSTGLLPSEYTPQSEIVNEYFVRGTEPSNVSEEFEQTEADSVRGLQAVYNEEAHEIQISWDYPEDLRDQFSFRLEIKGPDQSDFNTVDITKNMEYRLSSPEYGETYTIRVTAISDSDSNLTSDPAETQVTIPEEEIEEEEEIIDDLFEDENNENEAPENENNDQGENEGNPEENNNGNDQNEDQNQGDQGNGPGQGNNQGNGQGQGQGQGQGNQGSGQGQGQGNQGPPDQGQGNNDEDDSSGNNNSEENNDSADE
jgi:penicillin-binding protein 1A